MGAHRPRPVLSDRTNAQQPVDAPPSPPESPDIRPVPHPAPHPAAAPVPLTPPPPPTPPPPFHAGSTPAGVKTDADGIAPVFSFRRRRAVTSTLRWRPAAGHSARPPPTPPRSGAAESLGAALGGIGIAGLFETPPRPKPRKTAVLPPLEWVASRVRDLGKAQVALKRDAVRALRGIQADLMGGFSRALHKRCKEAQLQADLAEQRHHRAEAALEHALHDSGEQRRQKDIALAQLADMEAELKMLRTAASNMRDTLQDLTGTVRVVVRVRPALAMDHRLGRSSRVGAGLFFMGKTTDGLHEGVVVLPGSDTGRSPTSREVSNGHLFHFDRVFRPKSPQGDVFAELEPLLRAALTGKSVCIFAYGATGSGKTFTMDGPPAATPGSEEEGVTPRVVRYLLSAVAGRRSHTLHMAGYEVYNDTLRDIGCKAGAKSSSIPDDLSTLRHVAIGDSAAAESLLATVRGNRVVAATGCNDRSSRSHCVVRIVVKKAARGGAGTHRRGRVAGGLAQRLAVGAGDAVINLVDLAGSERVQESGVSGEKMAEACHVNKSLSALGSVISAIAKNKKHVPFRDSKLTRVLKPCLDGGSKTLMLLAVADTHAHRSHNLQSLRFGATVAGCMVSQKATQEEVRKAVARAATEDH